MRLTMWICLFAVVFSLPVQAKIVGTNDERPVHALLSEAFHNPKIIGRALFKSSNIKNKEKANLYRAARSVAALKYQYYKPGRTKPSRFNGTGFMISRTLLLTNHHTLGAWKKIIKAEARFGYLEKNGRYESWEIDHMVMSDPAFDYAIMKIKPRKFKSGRDYYPADRYGVLPLGLYPRPRNNQPIYVIGHPNGRPQQYCRDNSKILKLYKRSFHHTADTKGGSSGSPILNRNFEVIGLHFAGVKKKKTGVTYNKAYRMDFIWNRFKGFASASTRYLRPTPGNLFFADITLNTTNRLYGRWLTTVANTRRHPHTRKLLAKGTYYYRDESPVDYRGKKVWWVYVRPHWFAFTQAVSLRGHQAYWGKFASVNGRYKKPMGAYFLPEVMMAKGISNSKFRSDGKLYGQRLSTVGKVRPRLEKSLGISLESRWNSRRRVSSTAEERDRAYWVYLYPYLYVYGGWVTKKEMAEIRREEIKRAMEGGKYRYRNKVFQIKFPYYALVHGKFYERLRREKAKERWMSARNLPEGYWVYSFPYWYIFKTREKK